MKTYRRFVIKPQTDNGVWCVLSRGEFETEVACDRAEHLIDLAYRGLESEAL